MLRILGAGVVLLAGVAAGAILPEQVGTYTRGTPAAAVAPDQPLYAEYGLEAGEKADYADGAKKFTVTAWRLRESTGALALFQSLRPESAKVVKAGELNVKTPDGSLAAYGNYVFQFTGLVPEPAQTNQILQSVPRLEMAPLPSLAGFLPSAGLIPNSERYVLGPVSLERFEPRISPSQAAFHLGAEAQFGKYKAGKDLMTLGVFSYPTPGLARERFEEMQKIPGAVAKRAGPLVAVIVQPANADAAERLLALVRYQPNLTLNEKIPQDFNKGLSNMILSIMALAGILAGASIVVGVGFGGFKILRRKLGGKEEAPALTTLGIGDK